MGKVTRSSYAVLVASTIAHFFNHIYTGALSPFLPIIRDELSLNLTEAGIVTSAAVVTMTISHLVVGYLGDRGWRDIFIPASILLAAAIMLVSSFATTFLFLTAAMLLLGVGASGYHPSVFPALAEKFPKSSRATATGIQAIGGLVGMAIIPFLGVTMLVIFGGWRESFVLLSLAGFALFVPVTALMVYSRKEHFDEERGHEEGDGSDGWTRNFALLVVLMALRGMSFRCTTLLMPLYLVESEYSYDPILAGSFTTVMLVAGLVGEIVSAPLSDRVGRRVPFLIVSTGLSTPFLLLLNASLSQVALLLVLIGIGFFFFLGVPPNTAYQTEVVPKQSQGLAFGLLFSIGAIPGSLSPIVFGWIGDVYGLPMSIMFLVLTTGLATIFAALLKETKEPKRDTGIALDLIRVPD
ncbi:MAG: MFS transporter [Candidatus Thorarchaeota archaeon]|nr:MAG: MFS transporter [Candidatus Thorarchaeota archaeon]